MLSVVLYKVTYILSCFWHFVISLVVKSNNVKHTKLGTSGQCLIRGAGKTSTDSPSFLQVVLVDSRSHSFVPEGSHCEFLLTSFDSSWGVLENPRHSLPPNTTCRYHFQGRRHEIVWLSFVKYHAASADPAAYELGAECNARLRIWDGRLATNTGSPRQQVRWKNKKTNIFCGAESFFRS